MSQLTDFYRKKSDLLNGFKNSQSVIVNKKYLSNILHASLHTKTIESRPSVDWYPATNSFYPFSEDVDIHSRVNHALSTDRASESVHDCSNCACLEDVYSERDAQTQYLTSTPTSFLILGKPNVGEKELGKLLAEYWNCVYIEPETLILEEIENKTDAGNCIEFNLRNGRAIGPNTIARLLEKRVKSKTAQHRGFVVCGFPLIPNDLYEEEVLASDSAIFAAREVCAEVFEKSIAADKEIYDEGFEYLPECFATPPDLGSEVSHVCANGTYETDFEEQLRLVFEKFCQPFVIIYAVCANEDVIARRKNQMFDVLSRKDVDLVLEETDKVIYAYFSQTTPGDVDEVPEDFIDVVKNNKAEMYQQRELVSLPSTWRENVVTVLERYRRCALPTIEYYLLRHDLENVIRVDGRISPVRMFHAVKERLSVMPLQRVLVPESFENDADGEGGEDFGYLTLEQRLGVLMQKHAPSTMFKWSLSDWRFKCPVFLKAGIERDGDPDYAVHFMNKIYFLADKECYVKFKKNPRDFLLPYYPKPVYKICVMGHRCAGKSSVAKCLAYLFNCKVVKYEHLLANCYDDVENASVENKIDVLLKAIREVREQGWIIDGMLPNNDLFEALHPDHTPTIVVTLVDNDYQYLPEMYPQRGHADYNNYKKLFQDIGKEEVGWRTLSTTDSYKERTIQQILDQAIDDTTYDPEQYLVTLEEYVNELKQFDKDFESTLPLLSAQEIDVISVSVAEKSIDVVLKEVVSLVENRYGPIATVFTDVDRAQEFEDDHDVQSEDAGEEDEDLLQQRRQYGDTFHYCPVVFHEHFVLWKGKDKFTVKFDNKIYMLSNENAMTKFLTHPERYLSGKPPDKCPPPRICVVGPCGSGRTTLGNNISRNLGIYHYKFENLLKKLVAPNSRLSLYELLKYGIGGADAIDVQNYLSNLSPLPEHHLVKLLGPLWFGEYQKMYCTIPDVVIELSVNQGEIRDRLFHKCLADIGNVDESVRREEILTNTIDEESEIYDFKQMTNDTEACVNELENRSANERLQLAELKEISSSEVIPWATVDAGLPITKVFAQAMPHLNKLKLRNRSVFERVYEISEEMSDKLLTSGYCFLSKFGKTCPVQVFDNSNRIQMYLPSKNHYQLCPVVHRQYVYFLANRESLTKFVENPLKYVFQSYVHEPLLPLRLAVIGPPKSGKTTISERFKRDLGMQVVSRGKSCRYVLAYLGFTELAEQIDALLRTGEELPDDIVMRAIESCTYDARCVTQGFVFDGFPETVAETRLLTAIGLIPHLVFDLRAENGTIREYRRNIVRKGDFPIYSEAFIDHRFEIRATHEDEFFCWLNDEYQNNAKLVAKQCKWGVWDECYKLTLAAVYEMKHYHKYAFHDYVLRLSYMQVTPLEFLQRQSSYRQYCPCCLFFEYKLRNGGHPPDRTGLVQFRRYFYYLCQEHIELFIKDPEPYISPYNRRSLPLDLPVRVWSFHGKPYGQGRCVVCYWTNKPLHVMNMGNDHMAVTYRNAIYLFDTEQCLEKFMEEPNLYFSIKMSSSNMNDAYLSLKDLPVAGFLQQYDALKLIKAITNTNVLRPVIPGLGIATSACINIGLHLITNNPNAVPEFAPFYKEAQTKFHERRLKLIDSLARMKSTINPFLYYDEIMPKYIDPLLPEGFRCSSTVSSTSEEDKNEEPSELSDTKINF
ncbi:hypothetical protein FQR65_LT10815 [Abscondita terminalis]|nr:hypothetical protein FQR65_LT10815 [Abscondita terminalis]